MLTWMLFYLWEYLVECYLDAFCLCFKCLKFYLSKKKEIKNCPDNLNIHTTFNSQTIQIRIK